MAGRRPMIWRWTAGEEPLAQALCKNILNGEGIENARRLALYAKAVIAALAGLDEATLQNASSARNPGNFPRQPARAAQP